MSPTHLPSPHTSDLLDDSGSRGDRSRGDRSGSGSDGSVNRGTRRRPRFAESAGQADAGHMSFTATVVALDLGVSIFAVHMYR